MNDLVSKEMTTTSRIIAEYFGKAHRNVLQTIENLDCGEEFNLLNFQPIDFQDSKGRTYKEYVITRDGFTILAMGFTGKKAMLWKLRFLTAFNAMEAELTRERSNLDWKAARLQGKAVRKNTTDTIQDFIQYATDQGSVNAKMYYANLTKMEYKALDLLEQSKQTSGNFRDTLDLMQISFLQVAESIASTAIQKGMTDNLHYKEIYIFAKEKVTQYAHSVSWARLTTD
jgi:Rha family phage regulatory protein